jgi:hypothetical protein
MRSLRFWITSAVSIAFAVGVLASSASVHLRRACTEKDTPYLPLCAESPTEPTILRQELRSRIARNPGDAFAWSKLLVAESRERSNAVLDGAARTAPNNFNVIHRRAARALESGQLAEGVSLLVQILQNRGTTEAAGVVAQIAQSKEGLALLRPHLRPGTRWVDFVLYGGYTLKLPPGNLLPLVAEAIENSAVSPAARQGYMQHLKEKGHWLDAYGLWLSQHKGAVPILYNGAFDQPIATEGFDWEFTRVPRSRAGVVIEQEASARRGLVLSMQFTGRSFTSPILRQHIFAPPGSYRLLGEYVGSKLRTESGLTWTVLCTSGRKPVLARSTPLSDTGGVWKSIVLEFTVPPDCGTVTALQLEPTAQYEATTGLKGRIAFDGFNLSRSAD